MTITTQDSGGQSAAVQPGAKASTRQAQLMLATAAEYQAQQEKARAEMVAAVMVAWAGLNIKNPIPSWNSGIGERIYVLLSILMELVARDSNSYIRRSLANQGILYLGPDIDPLKFAGIASDGRDLESLLAGAVIKVRESQRQGHSDEVARDHGRNFLELVLNTQVRDAARAAESVSITVADGESTTTGKPVVIGWVRMLTPPSCGRCAVLAGKFYRWNSGFERHPNCDCRHIPTTLAGANEVLTNPYVYFNSLSEAEQDYYFGKAQAQAIRDGGDINQVVNASRTKGSMFTADDGRRYTREGTTKRGFARGVSGRVLRPTVWQIYRDANGNQEAAKALLLKFGYALPQR
jgi:hypothetical protein